MKKFKASKLLQLANLHAKSYLYNRKFDLRGITNSNILDSCSLSVAKSEKDLKQAFSLVYKSYLAKKITQPNPHKVQFNKFHFLPTTATVILKHDVTQEVIATMSIICDSPLGLPIDELEDISEIRKKGRVGEAGALSIKESARSLKGHILLPMIQYTYNIAQKLFGLDYAVFMFHPKASDFYQLMLSAEPISDKTHAYSKANHAPAVSMFAPTSRKLLDKIYLSRWSPPISRKMSRFLNSPSPKGIEPKTASTKYFSDYQSIYSYQTLKNIFEIYKDLNPEFSHEDQIKLQNLFFPKKHRNIFNVHNTIRISHRKEQRILTKCKGHTQIGEKQIFLYTQDISINGLSLISQYPLNAGGVYTIFLKIGKFEWTTIDIKIEWQNKNGQHGASIDKASPPKWHTIINELTHCLDPIEANEKKVKVA